MADDQKKVYKKPAAADVGKSANVLGQGGCSKGDNQTGILVCTGTGNTANGNCTGDGNTAGFVDNGNCINDGLTAFIVCSGTGNTALAHL